MTVTRHATWRCAYTLDGVGVELEVVGVVGGDAAPERRGKRVPVFVRFMKIGGPSVQPKRRSNSAAERVEVGLETDHVDAREAAFASASRSA